MQTQQTTIKQNSFTPSYFAKSGVAGGICCLFTHSIVVPIDVVKTKMQLDPLKYNKGMISTFSQVYKTEGLQSLTAGLGATNYGYFLQGFCKFGGTEYFKIKLANYLGEEKAWKNRTKIYIGASCLAEFIGDLLLCPFEAIRIKSVSDANFPRGVIGGMSTVIKNEGFAQLYSGLFPIVFKQIPYVMTQFVVQGRASEMIYQSLNRNPHTSTNQFNLLISICAGLIAGVFAAIASHPADTILSQINKKGAGGSGSTMSRIVNISKEMGFKKICLVGLPTRCVMISLITAGQFGIFDTVMNLFGAKKFYFTDPSLKKISE
eukprot:gene5884-9712_t